jgi:hypothetical protein
MDQTLEPDLKYCPRCSDEYRWDMQSCADCGLELLSGEQMMAMQNSRYQGKGAGSLSPEIGPDEPVVTVRKGSSGSDEAVAHVFIAAGGAFPGAWRRHRKLRQGLSWTRIASAGATC